MIEVKLVLHDAQELNLVAQLQQVLEMKRAQDNARMYEVPPVPLGEHGPASVVEPPTNIPAGEPAVPFVAAPTGLDAPAAPVPSDIEVARAITEYAQRAGLPAAKDVLTEFSVKNAMAIPMERRAEFVARVGQ